MTKIVRSPAASLELALLLSAIAMAGCSASIAQQPKAGAAPDAQASSPSRRLVIWESKPSDELELAAESLDLPVDWRPSFRQGVSCAEFVPRGKQANPPSVETKISQYPEAYEVVQAPPAELAIAAGSQHGLANGLYDARRALLVAGSADGAAAQILARGEHKPYFARRETYHFLSPWRLPRLSTDAFTLEQWKAHLRRMRALNVNKFYFDLWADQYYHPDHPETLGNKALYDRLREACDYAHRLGMRTGMYTFPAQVPTWHYLAHPEARTVEIAGYHGLHLCPSRAWDALRPWTSYSIEYFGKSLDDVVVEMQDPGSCVCAECCQQFPELVLRFMDAYRKLPGGPADRRVDLCSLHFRDWLEAAPPDSRVASPIANLASRVMDHLPPDTVIFDIDEPTLEIARQHRLKEVYFFFDLDPEGGLENYQVLPHAKLQRIEAQIKESVAKKQDGIMAYRMMPLAQCVTDYVLFRKCWDPDLDRDVALTELAAELGIEPGERPKFVKAIRDLDAWGEQHDLASLKEADVSLQELAASAPNSDILINLRDQVIVLAVLGDFWASHRESVDRPDFYPPPELVEQVYQLMLDRPIFEAYTVHQHWEGRAHEMIGQRLRWWLQGMVRW